ncbi:MAG TPA: PQQ-dependent sugar dehydrogenase [Bacteroidota bacterium]|nr:PQQ-dependent sugar dehydrogenase [Bacteroidota bacterium]
MFSIRAVLSSFTLFIAAACIFHADLHAQAFLTDPFPNLSFNSPIGFYHPNDTSNRVCVVEQGGVIRIFQNDSTVTTTKTFLDITDSIVSGGELGLLGLAFDPDYANNGYFYVDYDRDNPLRTVISRFRVSATNPDSADRSSELVLLEQLQPFTNHKGGQLAFGPDGYLYIAFGDGGSGGDPFGNGQNTSTLLGKIVRINVDSSSGSLHYAIPPTNPFYGDTTKRQEIFSYGMRNPWRFSFDNQTLWCADVGQDEWEEIDTILNGHNYGWNLMEATHCYNPPSGCNETGLTLPIWEYHHDAGRCAIMGGFVYRGSAIPSLVGKYIYGDYCTGEIWTLTPVLSSTPIDSLLFSSGTNISAFGTDRNHELYFCDLGSGKIFKFWAVQPGPFTLIAPPDFASDQPDIMTFSWTTSAGASRYHLQIASDSGFTTLVVNDSTVQDTADQAGPLPDSTTLYWRVRAMNGVGSTAFTPFRRFTTSTSSTSFQVFKSWNLLSLPIIPADPGKSALFPTAVSNAFLYNPGTGYEIHDTLLIGRGYWVKFGDTGTVGLVGTPITSDSTDVVTGWNMIGSLSQTIPTSSISSVPGGIVTSQFFWYEGSYRTGDSLFPGRGYWVKVNQDGKLIFSASPSAELNAGRIRIEHTTELPPAPPDAGTSTMPLPHEFALVQNYPNPFNPSTIIRYALPEDSHVVLKIYNMLGQEIATLVNEMEEAGYRSVTWDAGNVPSGIYIYRLVTGGFTDTRKMAVIK